LLKKSMNFNADGLTHTHTFSRSRFLPLPSKSVPGPLDGGCRVVIVQRHLLVHTARGGMERRRGRRRRGVARRGGDPEVPQVLGQRVFLGFTPVGEGALGPALVAPDESDEDVDAADGEEEEGGHDRELVYVVREDGGADAAQDFFLEHRVKRDVVKTDRHWKRPRAPKPKSLPRTGKNLSKKRDAQPNSDKRSTIVSPMIKRRLSTAQNAPAG
jgi:hypothetical protein